MKAKRICLISPGHLASDPRLVKEADALHEAGFAVRVVAGDTTAEVRPLDATIAARAPWPVAKVGTGGRSLHLARRLRQELAKRVLGCGIGDLRQAVWALSALTPGLALAAAAEPADLYIAHYLPALPAAAWAARRHGAKLGFDAEDDHVGELVDAPENQLELAIRRRIEAHFLPQCHHLTAASLGIADAYRHRYGVNMTPILNVFPLALAGASDLAPRAAVNRRPLSVYWFSQTIGPGRGLEQVIEAMGKSSRPVHLSIRGSDFLGYSATLRSMAANACMANAVSFLSSAPPDQMARLAAGHDVGLASELGTPPNRAISLTNKIFIYLLAGIPVLMSDTAAQRRLSTELGDAARVVDLADPEGIAAVLDMWAKDERCLAAAKREAWRLAHTQFNWDLEKQIFLRRVDETLGLVSLP
jgi:glycosyltransferase involved in cell wall biosynthesis